VTINTIILEKMGWVPYSIHRGVGIFGLKNIPFAEDKFARYFIHFEDRKILYVIKELTPEEKLISKNEYKFIECDYLKCGTTLFSGKKIENPKFEIIEFNDNMKLFSEIIRFNACNLDYQRYFSINKILK